MPTVTRFRLVIAPRLNLKPSSGGKPRSILGWERSDSIQVRTGPECVDGQRSERGYPHFSVLRSQGFVQVILIQSTAAGDDDVGGGEDDQGLCSRFKRVQRQDRQRSDG
jgi:hypothetical protein